MNRTGILIAALALQAGCVRKMAVNAVADALSADGSSSFARDDDLELVGDAVPFALKTMESLAEQAPRHDGLRLALAKGFTQYAVVWVQFPAERVKDTDYAAYEAGIDRARRLLLRARGWALAGMELRHPGFADGIFTDPDAALAATTADDVPFLYWLGASWMAAISDAVSDPELLGQLPAASAVVHRALDLDPDWNRGAIHELLISVEPALPLPGGRDRAREHFEQAVALSGGTLASPYVSLATAVAVPEQDREGFVKLLEQALAVDPDASPDDRLANTYARERARFLLDHVDDYFLSADDADDPALQPLPAPPEAGEPTQEETP